MKNDVALQVFVESMWSYQWIKNCAPYSDEMVNMLYDESQGIIDIAVKLYAIVQIEAITNGIAENGIEDLTRRMIGKCKYVLAGQYLCYCLKCAKEDIKNMVKLIGTGYHNCRE